MKYCWQSLFTFSCCVTCENGSWPVNFCSSVFSNDADMIFAALLKDPKIVEVRRMKLQTYLRLVIAQLSRDFPELVEHACRQTLIQTVPFFSYVFRVISFTECWGLSAGYQPRPQVVDRGTTARYGGQLRYI